MGYRFGTRSEANLLGVHPHLISLSRIVLELGIFDFGITCGVRGQEEQDKSFFEGKSGVQYPHSKHNIFPEIREYSHAIDYVIYVDGKATYQEKHKPSYYMATGVFKAVAADMGLNIRCGADWDGDFSTTDQTFHDLPHVEIILER